MDAGIACGMGLTCEPPMECCTQRMANPDGGRMMLVERTCVAPGTCPDGGTVMQCSSELSCATGELCCRAGGAGGAAGATTCAATCAMGETPVCETDAGCPAGDVCNIVGGAATGTCRPPPREAGAPPPPREGGAPPPPVRDAGAG